KLRYLRPWERARRARAREYSGLLASLKSIHPPGTPEGYEHVFHQYTILASRRNELQKFLISQKNGKAVYDTVPRHLQPIYQSLGHALGSFPESERAAEEVLSLPMFPELRTEQIHRVASAITEFYSR